MILKSFRSNLVCQWTDSQTDLVKILGNGELKSKTEL